MYDQIMLTLDGSDLADAAVEEARDLAAAHGSHVVLLDVLPEHRGPFPFSIEAWRKDERRRARAHLMDVRSRLLVCGVPTVEMVMAEDDSPARAIVDVARRMRCDAIIMATHGRSWFGRLVHGSIAQSVKAQLRGVDVRLVRPAL